MALQASGPIGAIGIRTEFGATSGTSVRFGAYRVSQTVSGLTNMPLDEGVPQSGPIKFSNFYSKKLNVVVDYTPAVGVGTTSRVNAKTDYDANNSKVVVIGNFRQRPVSPAATKVWIHTNGDLGSDLNAPIDGTSTITPELEASILFQTNRESDSPNYIYLTPPPASGYPTLTFGPDTDVYVSTVYTNVEYTISGNSGLKFRLNSSTQIATDDDGASGDNDYNDLVLTLVDGGGSFYTSGGGFYYKTTSGSQTITTYSKAYSAIRTGTWSATTDLRLDIGPNGRVVGTGGDGGKGGNANGRSSTAGSNGKDGSSAIGIQHAPITITNRGYIIAGFGGGGGGGGGWGQDVDYNIFGVTGRQTVNVGGSGGGGGRGLPGGSGGLGGSASSTPYPGNVGNSGNIDSGGKGGKAIGSFQNSNSIAISGAGGGGGNAGLGGDLGNAGNTGQVSISQGQANASAGTPGTLSQGGTGGTGAGAGDNGGGSGSGGGTGGSPGYAIVNGTASTLSISGIGTVIGTVSPINTIPV
jgi:hypothetical protein